MAGHDHTYRISLEWSGSTKGGWESYDRRHTWCAIDADGNLVEPTADLTADPSYGGNPALVNPEQLLVAAASSCQLLSFLALAAKWGIDVLAYRDEVEAVMPDHRGPMSITRIDLHPTIIVGRGDRRGPDGPSEARLLELVEQAHHECYVANSLRTEVVAHPTFLFAE